MSPLDAAIHYAEAHGWHLFPCNWRGDKRKHPLIKDQHGQATAEPLQLTQWWRHWPQALIGVSAGRKSGVVCLDIDVKHGKNGWDTLELLGHQIPETPMQHTASGGCHLLFAQGQDKIRSTTGKLGPGLDVRSDNNHFVAAAPGSGYSPDPICHLDNTALAPAPSWLNPPDPVPVTPREPVRHCLGLSPYADAALGKACDAILNAGDGQQRITLVAESFSIGTLAGAGGIPVGFARAALLDAASGMRSYDPHAPWTRREIERVVNYQFDVGMRNPRGRI